MGGLFKQLTSLITALAVGFTPLVQADASTIESSTRVKLETQAKGPEGKSNLTFTVDVVEPGQEVRVVESAVRKDPNATLTLVGSGSIDAIHPQLLYLQNRVLAFERVEFKPQQTQIGYARSTAVKKPSKAKALFVTVKAAGSFAAAYYLLGRDYAGVPELLLNGEFANAVKPLLTGNLSSTAKAFGLAAIISGYQIMFTSSWDEYLRSAGNAGRVAWTNVATAVGQTIKSGRVSDKFGRMLGAYGFNLLSTTAILGTIGGVEAIEKMQTAEGMIQVGTLAAVASWDAILDVFVGRQVELGQVTKTQRDRFIEYRLTYGPWLEGPALALSGTLVGTASASILAVVGTIGIIMTFAYEPAKEALDRRRAIASETGKPTLWQKIKAKFERKQKGQAADCQVALEASA